MATLVLSLDEAYDRLQKSEKDELIDSFEKGHEPEHKFREGHLPHKFRESHRPHKFRDQGTMSNRGSQFTKPKESSGETTEKGHEPEREEVLGEEWLLKAKYLKRTGMPGHYRYWYGDKEVFRPKKKEKESFGQRAKEFLQDASQMNPFSTAARVMSGGDFFGKGRGKDLKPRKRRGGGDLTHYSESAKKYLKHRSEDVEGSGDRTHYSESAKKYLKKKSEKGKYGSADWHEVSPGHWK